MNRPETEIIYIKNNKDKLYPGYNSIRYNLDSSKDSKLSRVSSKMSFESEKENIILPIKRTTTLFTKPSKLKKNALDNLLPKSITQKFTKKKENHVQFSI